MHCILAYALQKTSNETQFVLGIEKMFWVEAPFLGMDGDYVDADATAADVLFWTKANAAERGSKDPTAKVASGAFDWPFILTAKCLP